MKKIISAFMATILCFTITVPASASFEVSDQEIQEMYAQQELDMERGSSYFAVRMVWASAGRNGELEIGFEVGCPRTMNRLGATKIEIMRKSGSNWVPVQTYEYTDRGMEYIYGSDDTTHTEAVYFQGTVDRDYLAYITLRAEDDDGSDERVMITNTVTAKD